MTDDDDLMAAAKAAMAPKLAQQDPGGRIEETGVIRWDKLNEAGAEDAGLSPFDFLEENDELANAISAARRKIIMPDMEDLLHCTKVREVGTDDDGEKVHSAYFPHTVITDILNKAFGLGRCRLIEDGREIVDHPVPSIHPRTDEKMFRKEAHLWGRLEVWDRNDRVLITIPCDGSSAFKGRSQSVGQVFESARSNMIRKAASRINPHLNMADPKFHEKALWYNGVQTAPNRDTWVKLYEVLGADDKQAAWKKLQQLGLQLEEWEKESKVRIEAITLEARRQSL